MNPHKEQEIKKLKENTNVMKEEADSKSDFLEFYNLYQQSKNNDNVPYLLFDIDNFNQGTITRTYEQKSRKYDKDQIRRFMDNPEIYERQLREVSLYLYTASQEYKNIVKYLGNLLTHDYVLLPYGVNMDSNNGNLTKYFYKALSFLEDYNIQSKLSVVDTMLIRDDVYFAYERTDGESFVWQQLPLNYCRLLGTDSYECLTFEFDFSYFTKANVNIENYDPDFSSMFNDYSSGKAPKWQKLNPAKAICFKFDKSVLYSLPHFTGIFDDVIGLSEYKDLANETSRVSNYKLIHQKIPMRTDKDSKINSFLIDDKFATKFHNNLKANVGEGIGVATTPMDLEAVTLENRKTEEDLVGKAERNFFVASGTNQLLYSTDSTGSIGLERSIQNDESIMFSLLKQYELFFKKRLKSFSTRQLKWKLLFPHVSVYNKKDYRKSISENATFGYSKFCPTISQLDLLSLLMLEDKLGLVDKMIPLQSSHTSSGSDTGRPAKDTSDQADKTVVGNDNQSNQNRA